MPEKLNRQGDDRDDRGDDEPEPSDDRHGMEATRKAQKIASAWRPPRPAVRTRRWHPLTPERSSSASSDDKLAQRAIWAGGPPNPVTPIRVHFGNTGASHARPRWMLGGARHHLAVLAGGLGQLG